MLQLIHQTPSVLNEMDWTWSSPVEIRPPWGQKVCLWQDTHLTRLGRSLFHFLFVRAQMRDVGVRQDSSYSQAEQLEEKRPQRSLWLSSRDPVGRRRQFELQRCTKTGLYGRVDQGEILLWKTHEGCTELLTAWSSRVSDPRGATTGSGSWNRPNKPKLPARRRSSFTSRVLHFTNISACECAKAEVD